MIVENEITGCKEVNYLSRLSVDPENQPFSNIIFIGNGSIENGDIPLLNWFYSFHNEKDSILIKQKKIDYSTILSELSMRFKFYRGDSSDNKLSKLFCELIKNKKALGENYKNAYERKEIYNRIIPQEVEEILDKKDTLVVCYNWDPVFWELKEKNSLTTPRIKNIFQLHGSCYNPSTMVFPCEFVVDYSKEISHHLNAPDICGVDLKTLNNLHGTLIESLLHKNLNKIILWGLSLSDYDAEIMSILSQPFHRRRETLPNPKMIIINKDKKVTYRAKFLTGIYDNVKFINPKI